MRVMKKVFVALRLTRESGQGKLAGIYRYLSEHEPWNLQIVESSHELTHELVMKACADRTDGFILSLPNLGGCLDPLATSAVPAVTMDIHDPRLDARTRNIAFIENDAKTIAAAALDHFAAQGRFASYAYVPSREREKWVFARGAAFAELAAERGIVVSTHSGDIDLPSFLKTLNPPTAVFAATDIRANEVLQAAKVARLSVPRRLAVIGVDDNRLICENAQPHLSSIRPDFEEEGYRAAEELARMMNRYERHFPHLTEPTVIRVGIKGITVRESTAFETAAGRLVARALKYIDENATKGIAVEDVVRHMKVSRRLLYLRFAEQSGTSIRAAIEKRRLDEVVRLLRTTKLPTETIAARCGYGNANVLRNLFKRTFSVSLRDYRSRKANAGQFASRPARHGFGER